MKILVTGIAGFLGSHIAESLLRDGHEVSGFDDLSGGRRSNVPDGARWWVSGCEGGKQLFGGHAPEVVIHAAAYASEGYSHWCREFLYSNNIVGTANVINACVNAGVRHMIFLSSIAVYGRESLLTAPYLGAFNENHAPKPIDPYGVAKYASEMDLRCTGEMFGLQWTIFRPHNVFGTRQNAADRTRNFVSIALRHALDDSAIPIYGNGGQTRQFTPVRYVADIIAACVNKESSWNSVYNVGADTRMSIATMGEHVCKAVGVNAKMTFLRKRHEVEHAACDHSKVQAMFPDVKMPSLDETLREMVEEMKNGGALPAYQTPPKAEITKNQPEWAR